MFILSREPFILSFHNQIQQSFEATLAVEFTGTHEKEGKLREI